MTKLNIRYSDAVQNEREPWCLIVIVTDVRPEVIEAGNGKSSSRQQRGCPSNPRPEDTPGSNQVPANRPSTYTLARWPETQESKVRRRKAPTLPRASRIVNVAAPDVFATEPVISGSYGRYSYAARSRNSVCPGEVYRWAAALARSPVRSASVWTAVWRGVPYHIMAALNGFGAWSTPPCSQSTTMRLLNGIESAIRKR